MLGLLTVHNLMLLCALVFLTGTRAFAGLDVSVGGELRVEYNRYFNQEWGTIPDDKDGFVLTRAMVHSDFWLTSKDRFLLDLMSATVAGNENRPDPPDRDDFDVHQIFYEHDFTFLKARAGRQELSYGSGKFISLREGKNARSSFDGLLSSKNIGGWATDLFYVRPTLNRPDFLDDKPDSAVDLWGVFATRKESESIVDLYYFGIHREEATYDAGTAEETRHTIGSRFVYQNNSYDAEVEVAVQSGTFGDKNIEAWTVASAVGVKPNWKSLSRISLTAAIASGDRNRNDGRLETFYAMYPKGAFFGQIAQNGPSNFITIRPSANFAFTDRFSATLDYYLFWRESEDDGVYGIPGNLLRSGLNNRERFLGSQPGVEATYALSEHTSFAVFYAHFFAGSFFDVSLPGKDIDFLGARAHYRF